MASPRLIRLDIYLRELVEAVYRTFPEYEPVELEFALEEVHIAISKINKIGLLIDELVVNAFKHAFAETGNGKLTIKLSREKSDAVLTIADNGPGLPGEIRSGHSPGLSLIQFYAELLKADLEISNRQGTCFKIRLPLDGAAGEQSYINEPAESYHPF